VSVGTGAANGVVNVCSSALIFGRAVPAERGRVGGVVGGVASAAQLVAYTAGGALSTVLDPRAIFVLSGGLAVLAALPLARILPRALARPRPADAPATVPAVPPAVPPAVAATPTA